MVHRPEFVRDGRQHTARRDVELQLHLCRVQYPQKYGPVCGVGSVGSGGTGGTGCTSNNGNALWNVSEMQITTGFGVSNYTLNLQ